MSYRVANTKRNIIFGILSKLLGIFLQFCVRSAIIYWMSVEYAGLNSLFSSILQVLNASELGLSSAFSFALYKPVADNNIEEISSKVCTLRRIYLYVGMFIVCIGVCLIPFLSFFVKDGFPQELNCYILYFLFLINTAISYFLYGYKAVIINVFQRNDLINRVRIVSDIFKCLIQVIVIYLTKNVYLFVSLEIISTAVQNVIYNVICGKRWSNIKFNMNPDYSCLKKIRHQILGAALGRISLVCRNSFDNIIISVLLGTVFTAIYANYYYIFMAVNMIVCVPLVAMGASVGDSIVKGNKKKNSENHLKLDFIFMFIVGYATICLTVLYQPIMQKWMGAELLFRDYTMYLFCIYFYSCNLSQIRSVYSEAAGLWWSCKEIILAEMFGNIILNIILGVRFGVNGILYATIITSFLSSFIGITLKVYNLLFDGALWKYYLYNLLYIFVTIVGCIFINYVINCVINSNNIILKCAETILLSGIFIIVIYALIPFTNRYIKWIVNNVIKGK